MTELVVVVAILSVIAMMAVTKTNRMVASSKITAAETDLKSIADAFLNPESGYLNDMRGIAGFSLGYLRVANLLISTNLYGNTTIGDDLYVGVRIDQVQVEGCAKPQDFIRWNPETERGWHGPYLRHSTGRFPSSDDIRYEGDATFGDRGFFPPLDNLKVPADFRLQRAGCSIYGFPGEPAVNDPWGNPYVMQIPPAQAFPDTNTNMPDEVRFRYARIVSAGPDGRLDTPCYAINLTNSWETSWNERTRRLSRQAGLYESDKSSRGDDIVCFLMRNDVDEGAEEEAR